MNGTRSEPHENVASRISIGGAGRSAGCGVALRNHATTAARSGNRGRRPLNLDRCVRIERPSGTQGWTVNEIPSTPKRNTDRPIWSRRLGDRRTEAIASRPVSREATRGRHGEDPRSLERRLRRHRQQAPRAVRAVSLPCGVARADRCRGRRRSRRRRSQGLELWSVGRSGSSAFSSKSTQFQIHQLL